MSRPLHTNTVTWALEQRVQGSLDLSRYTMWSDGVSDQHELYEIKMHYM